MRVCFSVPIGEFTTPDFSPMTPSLDILRVQRNHRMRARGNKADLVVNCTELVQYPLYGLYMGPKNGPNNQVSKDCDQVNRSIDDPLSRVVK